MQTRRQGLNVLAIVQREWPSSGGGGGAGGGYTGWQNPNQDLGQLLNRQQQMGQLHIPQVPHKALSTKSSAAFSAFLSIVDKPCSMIAPAQCLRLGHKQANLEGHHEQHACFSVPLSTKSNSGDLGTSLARHCTSMMTRPHEGSFFKRC